MKKDINYLRKLIQSHLQSENFGDAGTELFSLIQDKANEKDILKILEEAYNQNPDGGDYDAERWNEVFKRIENQIDDSDNNINTTKIDNTENKPKRLNLMSTLTIAATMLAVSIIGIVIYNLNKPQDLAQAVKQANIKPGRNTATLTLANGKKIYLDEQGIGELAKESGVSITKNENGELVYTVTESETPDKIQYNTLATANGETARLTLPDGTKVWLNAASTLSYPSTFNGAKKREVSLSGEAYFEAKHNDKQPFIVTSKNQSVKVLGTHFDISAYQDDNRTKTTLLEGSVSVTKANNQVINNNAQTNQSPTLNPVNEANTISLSPGEQATLTTNGQLTHKAVNAETFIDWKEGYFAFDKEPLGSIMKRVGRWYNVEFVFENPAIKEERFYGTLSRYDDLSKMLKAISKGSEVTFTVQGNTIKISK